MDTTRTKTVIAAEEYRIPMQITEMKVLSDNNAYYICPRCGTTMEREFCAFCDRCGQKLQWKNYRKARRISCSKPYV